MLGESAKDPPVSDPRPALAVRSSSHLDIRVFLHNLLAHARRLWRKTLRICFGCGEAAGSVSRAQSDPIAAGATKWRPMEVPGSGSGAASSSSLRSPSTSRGHSTRKFQPGRLGLTVVPTTSSCRLAAHNVELPGRRWRRVPASRASRWCPGLMRQCRVELAVDDDSSDGGPRQSASSMNTRVRLSSRIRREASSFSASGRGDNDRATRHARPPIRHTTGRTCLP